MSTATTNSTVDLVALRRLAEIAAVNPQAVLAILDRLEAAEAERDRLREDLANASRQAHEDANTIDEMAGCIRALGAERNELRRLLGQMSGAEDAEIEAAMKEGKQA